MSIDWLARLERNGRRLAEIVHVLARYGLADWLSGVELRWIREPLRAVTVGEIPGRSREERLRLAFTDLGTTFVKLGQVLSTRGDLIGPELATELAQLQSAVAPEPWDSVRATIAAELGGRPEELFAEIDPVPLAAASIAQVHAARMADGREVVIKVQRVGIAAQIAADLDILSGLAAIAARHPVLAAYRPTEVVRQFRRTILRELDFAHERRNLEEFLRRFDGEDEVRFPAPVRERCARRVLTMERLRGVPGTDGDALRASGEDLDAFARRGADAFLAMIFRDGFYHADPHPGNLMLLPGGVVGIIDCGMAGRIDADVRERIADLLVAAAGHDGEALADAVTALCRMPEDCDRPALREDLDDFLDDHVAASLADMQLGAALGDLLAIVRRHALHLPVQVALLLRTLVVLEGTSRRLTPSFSLAELLVRWQRRSLRRMLSPRHWILRVERARRAWVRLAEGLPRGLADVFARVRDGSYTIHLEHRNLDAVVNRLVAGVIDAALIVAASVLWATKAPPLVGGVSVLGASGYVIAAWIGWRLWRGIRRSGGSG